MAISIDSQGQRLFAAVCHWETRNSQLPRNTSNFHGCARGGMWVNDLVWQSNHTQRGARFEWCHQEASGLTAFFHEQCQHEEPLSGTALHFFCAAVDRDRSCCSHCCGKHLAQGTITCQRVSSEFETPVSPLSPQSLQTREVNPTIAFPSATSFAQRIDYHERIDCSRFHARHTGLMRQ